MELWAKLGWRRDVIHSPHSAARCVQILNQDIDGLFAPFGAKPAIGNVGARGGSLRKRISYRNSFQTVMRLSFQDTAAGCRIIARSFMSTFAIVFMVIWFGIVIRVLFAGFGPYGEARTEPLAMGIPIFMLLSGIGLVAFCNWLARGEHAFLLEFVRGRVDGQIETEASSSRASGIVY